MGIISAFQGFGSTIGGLFATGGQSARSVAFQALEPSLFQANLERILDGSEYDPNVRGRQGIITYTRMSREDSRIAAGLSLLKDPIKAATWTVEASSDGVQRFVEEELGLRARPERDLVSVQWDRFLREVLSAIEIGFALHEMLWRREGEQERLRALAFRPQIAVNDFKLHADDDRLAFVEQIKNAMPMELVNISADRPRLYGVYADGCRLLGPVDIAPHLPRLVREGRPPVDYPARSQAARHPAAPCRGIPRASPARSNSRCSPSIRRSSRTSDPSSCPR